jgi:Zn-dependent protease with chaperone function
MNFFAEQDDARKKTKYLVFLFVIAVISLTVITSLIVATGFWIADDFNGATDTILIKGQYPLSQYLNWTIFGKISLFVSGTILCVIIFKWISLSGGGKNIAESLGGVRLNPNTENSDERRILNIVEEMALASGMPVPPVYLLKKENGINAFAAGTTPANAVVGITQGALDQFNREQLQGVIAHEFSHILNGDMRLNLRLIAMLSGILFISSAGRLIMHAGSGGYGRHRHRRSGDIRVLGAGLILMLVGWLGSFFAGMIKAAISRQREFLADASSVQFTRNPHGIANALKIMGGYSSGSRLSNPNADEASHMFIGSSQGPLELFATHPPLEDRIRKIEPSWNGEMIHRKTKLSESEKLERKQQQEKTRKSRQATVAAAIVAGAAMRGQQPDTDFSSSGTESIPPTLDEMARDPFGASTLIFALLLHKEETVKKKQIEIINKTGVPGLSTQTLQLVPDVASIDISYRLPLLELAIPALKIMSAKQYEVFKKTMMAMIYADNEIEMFEWCLFQLITHYLASDIEGEKPSKPLYKKINRVSEEYRLILSMLAHHGHQETKEADS